MFILDISAHRINPFRTKSIFLEFVHLGWIWAGSKKSWLLAHFEKFSVKYFSLFPLLQEWHELFQEWQILFKLYPAWNGLNFTFNSSKMIYSLVWNRNFDWLLIHHAAIYWSVAFVHRTWHYSSVAHHSLSLSRFMFVISYFCTSWVFTVFVNL